MAMLPSVFQTEGKGSMGFDVMPAGWYEAEVVKSELKTTKAGNGKYLSLQLKIIDGEYKGRFVFANLNLVNPNQTAVEIAEKELATLCRACGLDTIEDSAELHGIPIGVKLGVKPETAQWPAKNEIKGYCNADEIDDQTRTKAADEDSNPF